MQKVSQEKYTKYRGVEMVCRVKPVKVKFTENEWCSGNTALDQQSQENYEIGKYYWQILWKSSSPQSAPRWQ